MVATSSSLVDFYFFSRFRNKFQFFLLVVFFSRFRSKQLLIIIGSSRIFILQFHSRQQTIGIRQRDCNLFGNVVELQQYNLFITSFLPDAISTLKPLNFTSKIYGKNVDFIGERFQAYSTSLGGLFVCTSRHEFVLYRPFGPDFRRGFWTGLWIFRVPPGVNLHQLINLSVAFRWATGLSNAVTDTQNKLFQTNRDNNKRLVMHKHQICKRSQRSFCNIEKCGRVINILYTKYAKFSFSGKFQNNNLDLHIGHQNLINQSCQSGNS